MAHKEIQKLKKQIIEEIKKSQWSTAYINSFPDSSFAVVESGYKDGMDKRARHLPYKDKDGKIDLPHLRNALARVNQIQPMLGNDTAAELQARAKKTLEDAAKTNLGK